MTALIGWLPVAVLAGMLSGVGPRAPSARLTASAAAVSTELHTARFGAVAAPLPGGEVLIAGGLDHASNSNKVRKSLRTAELFNPANDTFTALPATKRTELHTMRFQAVAAPLPDGQVLIAGGTQSYGTGLRTAELFDPAGDTFSAP